ncbi:MAG: hypothetical protein MUO50_01655, partial [Longimicrobiales bacterium]|nr:hypothetical protein [Longimicrobiales bacterium]
EDDRRGVEALVDDDLERWAEKDSQYSLFLAEIFALVDEPERALDWLENAADRGNINYRFIAEYDPFLNALREEPRFKTVRDRIRRGWEEHVS